MFQCGLAEVKNNYIKQVKPCENVWYSMPISKTSTLYTSMLQP